MAGDTKSLAEVLRNAIEARVCEIHTAMPGQIEKVDLKLGTCDVKPLLKRKYVTKDEAIDLPVITNVPILFPRTKLSYIKLPLAKGDTGQIIFNERAIDTWKLKGGSVDPKFSRKHALSDAVFIPGLFPITLPIVTTGSDSDLEIGNGIANVTVKKDGKFKVGNGTIELLTLFDDTLKSLDELVKALQGAVTATVAGPQPLDPATQVKFVQLITTIATTKTKLGLIKG